MVSAADRGPGRAGAGGGWDLAGAVRTCGPVVPPASGAAIAGAAATRTGRIGATARSTILALMIPLPGPPRIRRAPLSATHHTKSTAGPRGRRRRGRGRGRGRFTLGRSPHGMALREPAVGN